MPLSSILSLFSIPASIVNTRQVNDSNERAVQMTNQANRELVATQNAYAKQESELAYKRSLPVNQVSNLMQSGMSRAGAINTLNGGGSYTPAPVNTSQDQAPQYQAADLSGLANLAQIAMQNKQLKQQEKLANLQIEANKEEADKQREHELLLKDIDTANTTQNQYLEYQKHLENLGFEREKWNYLAPLQKEQLRATIDVLNLDKELKNEQKRDLIYRINEYQSKENRDMRDAVTLMHDIAAKYNYTINKKDFYDYRDRYYMPIYENGEVIAYEPRRLNESDNFGLYGIDRFWSVIGTLIPIEYLGKIIKSIF